MLLGTHWVLNQTSRAFGTSIYPYVLSTQNRRNFRDNLREVRIPDVHPVSVIGRGRNLSLAAGEFVEVYKDGKGEWDALLTAFFIDTAKNIFQYIRVFADIV